MVDQPNRCQTWLPTLLKIVNLTKNRHVKIVNLYKNFFSSETMAYNRNGLKSYNAWFIINE
jgi:hypothetical protein